MTTAYERSKIYSIAQIEQIRKNLLSLSGSGILVLTCGSYARREASKESDLDYFVVGNNGDKAAETVDRVRNKINKVVLIPPATDGAFAKFVNWTEMLECIGGDNDSNSHITRRMLFLLEGEWLFNEDRFHEFRREMLQRYIQQNLADHQLALFLLNDIIRYYRTIAVDYEYKISGSVNKPWAIRNIKLVFSRKLLYASGLFSVANTVDRTSHEKIQMIDRLFRLPVIDRMIEICGENNMRKILESYNIFLEVLEEKDLRNHLEILPIAEKEDANFRRIKNEGHRFTRELMILF